MVRCPLSTLLGAESTSGETSLERAAIALLVAVAGLLLREAWQAYRSHREQRSRDRAILSALLRELSMIAGVVGSMTKDINKERSMLAAEQRWRLKPLVRLPTATYDLVKPHIPTALLAQKGAVPCLAVLQAQCEYTNDLVDQYMKWKTPEARGQPDQIETLWSFHESISESLHAVAGRLNDLRPLVVAAGQRVGGLNLEGPIAQ
jgi:hypothetical protein